MKKNTLILFSILFLNFLPLAQARYFFQEAVSDSILRIQIKEEKAKGNFQKATEAVDKLLKSPSLTAKERYDLDFEKDLMARIRREFTKTEAEVLAQIKEKFPNATPEQIANWEKDKSLEMRIIDGEKRYFYAAVRNLQRIEEFFGKSAQGTYKSSLLSFCEKNVPEVIQIGKPSKTVQPVKMKIRYTLTVKPNVIPAGEKLRVWLPFPISNDRQKDIKLLKTKEVHYQFNQTGKSAHNSFYMEDFAKKDQPTVFNYELSYTAQAQWFDLKPEKIKPYDTTSQIYKTHTAERPPNIVFSPRIKELAKKIVGNETNPYLKARKIFTWIDQNIPWASALEYSVFENIPEYVLENRHGDCGMQTLLFMALARYSGLPTKWQSGWMMHPDEVNLHDWAEVYYEGIGWVPLDQTFDLLPSENEAVRYFYTNGIDAYRFTVNEDFAQDFYPKKEFPRSETVDFQRGEVEWKGGNLYFDKWSYKMEVEYLK